MNLEKILQQAEIKVIQYPNKALILVKDNLDAIKKQDNLDMLITAYYIIASANARLDKYNDAITYIKKCLKLIYQDDIQNNIRIEAHILLAWSLISIENKEDAIKEIYIALKIATAEKNYHQLYRSLIVKALIHERCGQHYAALQAYKKAKHTNAEYPTVISRTNLAVSSLNIANIFNYLENYDIAIDYYNEALRYLETEDAPMQKLYLKYNIYTSILQQGTYKKRELEKKIKQLIVDFQQLNIKKMEGHTMACLCQFYLKNDWFDKAEQYAKESILYCKKLLIKETKIYVAFYIVLFKVNWKNKDFDTAIYYGELILNTWKENYRQLDEVCKMIEKLILLYENKSDNEKGLKLAMYLSELKEKSFNHKENFKIDKLRSEMEIEQKKREIAHIKTLNNIEKINNEKLKFVNKELENFVGIVSHDLKAPLRSIIGFSKILQSKASVLSSEEQEYLNLIIQSGQHMNNLLEDLLSYAKAGKYKEKIKNVDLNDVLFLVKTNLNALITEKKAIIHIAKMPIIQAHFSAMTQLFQNLISNALIYSRKDVIPIIYITTNTTNDSFHISIKDNGQGIDSQKIDTIFEPFVRGNNLNMPKGTGLGLATCKKIISYYNGNISVKSEIDKGTTFMLSFYRNLS